jgi:hypothetical protein
MSIMLRASQTGDYEGGIYIEQGPYVDSLTDG